MSYQEEKRERELGIRVVCARIQKRQLVGGYTVCGKKKRGVKTRRSRIAVPAI